MVENNRNAGIGAGRGAGMGAGRGAGMAYGRRSGLCRFANTGTGQGMARGRGFFRGNPEADYGQNPVPSSDIWQSSQAETVELRKQVDDNKKKLDSLLEKIEVLLKSKD